MKRLLVASMLYILATIPALADAPPALLGELDASHIQQIENAEDVRGKRFSNYWEARSFCKISWNWCYDGLSTGSNASYPYYMKYFSWTVKDGWNTPSRWRKF